METHVASVKMDDGVWFGGSVVHQIIFLFNNVGGGQRLLGVIFVESNKHGGIDGT